MRTLLSLSLAWVVFVGAVISAQADLFKNTDFSNGLAGWHGDGRMVYLAADGTEKDEAGPGLTPAIKLRLSHDPQQTYQEVEVRNNPSKLDISVEVMPSANFRRSREASDYNVKWSPGGTWYWSSDAIPDVDFWIKGAPGFFYKPVNLQTGQWLKIESHFENLKSTDAFTINFCVPPGDGAIYIKNPSANASN